MRFAACTWICLIIVFLPLSSSAADKNQFDGSWDTILSCTNNSGAMGYSFKFSSTVKDGLLHGEKGTKGLAGWLEIDGKISADGTAKLYANGLIGASQYAVGQRPAGTQYGYHLDVKFTEQQGSGKRVEGRPCEVAFNRVVDTK